MLVIQLDCVCHVDAATAAMKPANAGALNEIHFFVTV